MENSMQIIDFFEPVSYVNSYILELELIFYFRYCDMYICLRPDGHCCCDGKVVGSHHQVVVVVPEVLPLEPGLGLKVHCARK